LNLMDRKGARQVTPRNGNEGAVAPFVEKFSSGYVQRAIASWPKQGAKAPWRVYQNYLRDVFSLKWSSVENSALEFSNPAEVPLKPAPEAPRHQLA
jgi:monooxygenase